MSRFIVVWCPNWPIVAARADRADTLDPSTPLALSHGHYVTACSAEAQAEGVRVGQRLREAQSSCPTLQLVPDQPERDQRVFSTVLQHLADTVATVSVVDAGMVVCRARGLARYYGSENAAAEALRQAVANSPVPTPSRAGIADSLFTAQQAAKRGTSEREPVCVVEPGADADFLAPLPVAVLGDSHLATLLGKLGVNTLAEFSQMNPEHVHERFGPHGTLVHHWARGIDPRRTAEQDVPQGTDVTWRSDEPITQLDTLSFALLADATRFIDALASQHTVCTSVRITMVDERGDKLVRTWTHPRYFTASDLVNRVGWQWQARPTSPDNDEWAAGIVEVSFEAITPDDLADHEPGLWGYAPVNARVEHAIAQLQSRLGHRALTKAHTRAGHDWSDTESLVPWGEAAPPDSTADASWPGAIPKPLPATVFTPALPVSLRDGDGEALSCDASSLSGQPAEMVLAGARHRVTAWAGPWPVVERWWDPERARHRYRLQLLDGEGVGWLVSRLGESGQWVVEARYD